ncbi:MAG: hypothetical protein WA678_05540 [Rhabdochlamydiaceae bacterium]|jgi:hypothetical protein
MKLKLFLIITVSAFAFSLNACPKPSEAIHYAWANGNQWEEVRILQWEEVRILQHTARG